MASKAEERPWFEYALLLDEPAGVQLRRPALDRALDASPYQHRHGSSVKAARQDRARGQALAARRRRVEGRRGTRQQSAPGVPQPAHVQGHGCSRQGDGRPVDPLLPWHVV